MLRKVVRAISLVLCFGPLGAVMATEGGGTSKALGVDTVLSGVMPPPGLRLTTFVGYYDADRTLDSSGNGRAGISDFNLSATAVTPRLQYVWSGVELWGANIETRLGLSAFVDAHVSFDVQTPGGRIRRQGSSTGMGDALIGPALLGWHHERFHQIAGLEFFLPTGKFDKTRLANTSRGYYAVGPAYLFTWLPTDASPLRTPAARSTGTSAAARSAPPRISSLSMPRTASASASRSSRPAIARCSSPPRSVHRSAPARAADAASRASRSLPAAARFATAAGHRPTTC